jgi:hypothetical protein
MDVSEAGELASVEGLRVCTIDLPLSRQLMAYAALLMVIVIGLTLSLRLFWPVKLTAVAVLLLWGGWLWRRYLQRRPASLQIGIDGELRLVQAGGGQFAVTAVLPGVISPTLVSARLSGRKGEHADLFVPASSLDQELHWRLRRALIGFRPPQVVERRGT